jgi:hypothetical protein
VIGSNGSTQAVATCLAALEPQREGTEVLVCEPAASSPELRERYGWARFVELPGALVPELWREGIDRSSQPVVALTISAMIPAADWVEKIRALQRGFDVVAGAIEPGEGLRLSDWAEYFCRYPRDMLPFEEHECDELPGDNSAYKRELMERTRELYRDGFWEPVVNRRLSDEEVRLWHTPELLVRQGRSAGTLAFIRQRLAHGRAHGRQRGDRFGRARNLLGAVGAPLVPLLLALRLARELRSKRRYRLRALAALPWVLVFNAAWAAGEALGHLERASAR